jgi:hypothetical protein
MPGRINLRIYPFEHYPSFQIMANLKKECFLDGDIDHVLFTYGPRPNIKLTVFGLITSIPNKEDEYFNPLSEFESLEDEEKTSEISFEQGMRGLFVGMEGFEKMIRFSRYPNVTIYPYAVYRNIVLK